MHELSITRNIVAIVSEAARGHRVRTVTLEVGALSGVMADSIAFCFGVVSAETPVAGARLDIRKIDGRGRCRLCGSEFPAPALYSPCPCGSRDVELIGGEELNIKSLELEEAA
jgi:hydrogenase nickel incorporation protein HypA/HybF